MMISRHRNANVTGQLEAITNKLNEMTNIHARWMVAQQKRANNDTIIATLLAIIVKQNARAFRRQSSIGVPTLWQRESLEDSIPEEWDVEAILQRLS
jgi:hypothetical protein